MFGLPRRGREGGARRPAGPALPASLATMPRRIVTGFPREARKRGPDAGALRDPSGSKPTEKRDRERLTERLHWKQLALGHGAGRDPEHLGCRALGDRLLRAPAHEVGPGEGHGDLPGWQRDRARRGGEDRWTRRSSRGGGRHARRSRRGPSRRARDSRWGGHTASLTRHLRSRGLPTRELRRRLQRACRRAGFRRDRGSPTRLRRQGRKHAADPAPRHATPAVTVATATPAPASSSRAVARRR